MSETLTVSVANLLLPTDYNRPIKSQRERITTIAKTLSRMRPNDSSLGGTGDLVFVSELELENLTILSEALGMVAVATCEQDDTSEANALLVHPELCNGSLEIHEDIVLGTEGQSRKALRVDVAGVQVVGVHHPWQKFSEYVRYVSSKQVFDYIDTEKPALVLGDFNSLSFLPSRRIFQRRGLISSARYCRENLAMPAPGYDDVEKTSLDRLLLWAIHHKLKVDDIYTNLPCMSITGAYSDTDHPLLQARLKLPKTTEINC